jgi:hypothetical protein
MSLLDFLQSASNTAASNVTAPVDAIAWLLRKAGVDVGEPMGGSDWAKRQGLMRDVPQSASSLAGETAGLLSPALLAAKAPQIAKGLLQMGDNLAAPATLNPQLGATVWHGSPHKFDAFDSAKIGTGEGAQAYGHGLYLADAPDVAKTYSKMSPEVMPPPNRLFRGQDLTPGTPEYHAGTLLDSMGLQQARKTVAGWIKEADPRMAKEAEGWQRTLDTLNSATSKSDFKVAPSSHLYKVDLPDSHIAKMLDWDKPLSQQAPGAQGLVGMLQAKSPRVYQELVDSQMGGPLMEQVTGRDIYRRMHEAHILTGPAKPAAVKEVEAATAIRKAGIPGIRYLDGGSRGAGTGTSNYVVFPGNEDILQILERNGIPIKGSN